MALNVKPIGDRILVEPAEEKETKRAASSFRYRQGKTAGRHRRRARHGKTNDDGKKIPFEVKRATAYWSPNTAARKSKLTARNTRFCRVTTFWQSLSNSRFNN